MEYAAMALQDLLITETCLLEMVINIACIYEIVSLHLLSAYSQQVSESLMWFCLFVFVEAVAIKEPKLVRIFMEEGRVGSIRKTHIGFFEKWIFFPKTFFSSKIW